MRYPNCLLTTLKSVKRGCDRVQVKRITNPVLVRPNNPTDNEIEVK